MVRPSIRFLQKKEQLPRFLSGITVANLKHIDINLFDASKIKKVLEENLYTLFDYFIHYA